MKTSVISLVVGLFATCGLSAIAADGKTATNAAPACATCEKPAAAAAAVSCEGSLFDGKTLKGWKCSDFIGHGKVEVADGCIVLRAGGDLTGISWAASNSVPRVDYELELDAKRVDGSDFFCGLTFPVGKSCCTLVLGGWGGSLVGISSIDGMDASENETSKSMTFEKNKWYHVRVRVTQGKIEAWVDKEQVADVETTDKKISMRPGEIEDSAPLGIATYDTTGALKNIKLRRL